MYKDEIKKINYYKNRIVAWYLQQNKILNKDELDKKIKNIDAKLAIFRQAYIENGETLNIKKFNEQKHDIYSDLKILYEVMYESAKKHLVDVQAKAEYEMRSLEERIKKYKYRSQIETMGVFGESVYYETNGFDQLYDNGKVYIRLGKLQVKSGSYLVCQLGCRELEDNIVSFNFDDQYRVLDYKIQQDYLKIPGNYNIKKHDFELKENTTTSFKIDIPDMKINEENKYNIFGGKNKIKVKYLDDGTVVFKDKKENVPFVADRACEITLYVYEADSIIFDMNDKIDNKSFDGYRINSPKQRQKIYIKAKQGFVFDFSTDGTVYAEKHIGYIENKELYSKSGFGTITDYMVEEISFGEPVTFNNVTVEIKNAGESFYDIDYISIKQTQVSELDNE